MHNGFEPRTNATGRNRTMHTIITPLFGNSKVKLSQTPRAVTPFGGLVSFISFLEQRGLVDQLQKHLPWHLTSPNAIPLAHTLVAFILSVITGAQRFAHTEMARADRGLHALLGIQRWPGTDTVRALFHRFTQGTIQSFWRPLWSWLLEIVKCPPQGVSLDLDSTVFQRSGQQAGAAKGYNPRRPGRKSHHPLLAPCWPKCLSCSTAGCAAATPVRPKASLPFWPKRWSSYPTK